jgi:hypothetical protein
MYSIPFSFNAGDTEIVNVLNTRVFRPFKVYTDIREPGQAYIHGIFIIRMGPNDSMIVGPPIDAWEFSTHLVEKMRRAFDKEHGLVGKTPRQIQRYLDRHELRYPDVGQLDLPTMTQGQTAKITGAFKVPCGVALLGSDGR